MQKVLLLSLLLGCSVLHATTNTDEKTRLKPRTGNVIVIFRPATNTSPTTSSGSEQYGGEGSSETETPENEPPKGRGRSGNDFGGQRQANNDAVHQTQFQILAYPNPTTDRLSVEVPYSDTPTTIALYTVTGQELLRYETTEQRTELDVSQFTAGMYLIQVQNGQNTWGQKISVLK